VNGDDELPGGILDTGPDPVSRRAGAPGWLKAMAAFAAVLAASSMTLSAVLFFIVREERCRGLRATQADRVDRLADTERFVKSPLGLSNEALVVYVREVGLPQLRTDVRLGAERIPRHCRR